MPTSHTLLFKHRIFSKGVCKAHSINHFHPVATVLLANFKAKQAEMSSPSISSTVMLTSCHRYPTVDHNVERMLKMRTVVSLGALLPGLGCYFCIAYTYLFQFERVLNFTQSDQCPTVHSILPPVSYSIGVWEPQKFFWLLIMFLHMPPRIFFLVLYRRMFLNSAPKSTCYQCTVWFYMKTLWLEPIGLVFVSVVDIHSHFVIHAIAYAVWIISFNFNMLFNIILQNNSGLVEKGTLAHLTWRIKLFMFITGCVLSVSTAISYPLFMSFCSPEAYLAFSIAEYIMVGYNSFFYCLAFWDFPKTRVTLGIRTGPHPRKIMTSTDVTKIPL